MRLIEEIRAKHPAMAKRAKRSPLAACRLHCLECMGGSAVDVKTCEAEECALHRFRLGKGCRKAKPQSAPQCANESQDAS